MIRSFLLLCLCVLSAKAQTFQSCTVSGLKTAPGAELVLKGCTVTGPIICYLAKSVTVQNCWLDLNGQQGLIIQGGCPTVLFTQSTVANARTAFQLDGVSNDPHVEVSWIQDASGPTNCWDDQFSVYMSSGVPGHPILLHHIYVQIDPSSPYVSLAGGIVAGDTGSRYVTAIDNLCVNCPIVLWADNGNTSLLINNRVSGGFPGYDGLVALSGYAVGNVVDWTGAGTFNFTGVGGEGNNVKGTLTNLYWQWQNEYLAYGIHLGP